MSAQGAMYSVSLTNTVFDSYSGGANSRLTGGVTLQPAGQQNYRLIEDEITDTVHLQYGGTRAVTDEITGNLSVVQTDADAVASVLAIVPNPIQITPPDPEVRRQEKAEEEAHALQVAEEKARERKAEAQQQEEAAFARRQARAELQNAPTGTLTPDTSATPSEIPHSESVSSPAPSAEGETALPEVPLPPPIAFPTGDTAASNTPTSPTLPTTPQAYQTTPPITGTLVDIAA